MNFYNFDLGDIITLVGVLAMMWHNRKTIEDRQQQRHEENLQRLNKLEHLDECVDDLKEQLRNLIQWLLERKRL